MQNPSKIEQPQLKSPLRSGKKNKGRAPYLRYRKKLGKEMWR